MIIGLSGVAGSGKDFIADLLVKNHDFVKIALADPLKRICRDVFDFSDEQLWGPSEKRNQPDKRYFTGRVKTGIADYEDARIFAILDRKAENISSEPTEEEILEYCKIYLTPRFALQFLGTEWGRNCYPNVWIEYCLRIANNILKKEGFTYSQKDGLKFSNRLAFSNLSTIPKGVVISDIRFANEMEAIRSEGGKVIRIVGDRATTLRGTAALHASEREQQEIPDSSFDYILHNRTDLESLTDELAKMLRDLQS